MKAVKILVGVVASIYSVLAGLQLFGLFGATESPLATRIVPLAIGLAVAIGCFQSAFKQPEKPDAD